MTHRHKKIIYGILIICMVFFGIFGSENLLRDGERTQSETMEHASTTASPIPDATVEPIAEMEHTSSDAQMTVLDVRIQEKIKEMTLEEKVGQMFFVKNDGRFGPDELTQYPVGGIILFAGDLVGETADSLTDKIRSFQNASDISLLIGTDEEGGTVTRVSRYSALADHTFASPRSVYASGGMDAIREDTEEKSKLLLSYGINVNFAPVCDLSGNKSDFIYERSFGDDPQETAEYVDTVVTTMQKEQIGTVLKHFPGYGSNGDTHVNQIEDTRTYEQFVTRDYIPFEAGVNAGADCILVSHNVVAAIDDEYPASLSKKVHDEIRNVLQFDGVVITDDLMMSGVSSGYDLDEAAVQAVKAGNDMLLSTNYQEQIKAVIQAVQDGEIDEAQIDAAVARVLKWKNQLGLEIF